MELAIVALGKVMGSAGFGTVFGGLMGLLNRKTDLEYKKLEYADHDKQRAHELKQRELDAVLMEKEWAGRVQVATVEAEGKTEAAAYDAMAKSYDFAKPAPGGAMEAFSSFVRPAISLGYFGLSSAGGAYILYFAFLVSGVQLSQQQMYDLVIFVVDYMAFMTSTAVGWWFAMRPGKSPAMKGKAH